MINIVDIKTLCDAGLMRPTNHIMVRLSQRGIKIDDIVCVLSCGEIIEQYPSDYPYPSCLVAGETAGGRPLHIVCGLGGGELWLITAYYPDAGVWLENFKIRKGRRQ